MNRMVMAGSVLCGALVLTGGAQRSSTQGPQTPEAVLGAAIHQEEAEGNLEAAIESYQTFLARYGENRSLAVQALLRMGQAYERLGRPDAREAYERVVRDYADQAEEVSVARTRLAGLAQDAPTTRSSEMVARRVWDGPEVDLTGRVSPDGRYLTYVDWSRGVYGGDLALRDLTTGDTRHLTNKGTSREYALVSTPSPDGTLVAYQWFNPGGDSESESWDLRIIGIDGSEPRVYRNPAYPVPHAWSPDAKQILATFWRGGSGQIVLVSVADGAVRVLRSLSWQAPRGMSLSPDGRFIAYDRLEQEDSSTRDIFLLATDGSREVPLVEHPADDGGAIWAPDGKTILFTSDRTGRPALWAVDVADGSATGPARFVSSEAGQPLGLTSSGSYYFARRTGQDNVYIAALDPASGHVSGSPEKLLQRVQGSSGLSDWSPDGRSLAYLERVTGPATFAVVRSVDTGTERRIQLDLPRVRRMRWFPDGRSLLLTGWDAKRRRGIYRIDLDSGATTLLVLKEEPDVNSCVAPRPVVSADGATMFHTRHISGSRLSPNPLFAHDLTTGEEREIYRPKAFLSGFALSPDGRQLAFSMVERATTHAASLHLMPVGGGAVRDLLTFPGDPTTELGGVELIAWTAEGLVYAKPLPYCGAPDQELWRLSLDAGEPVRVDLPVDGAVRDLSVHPDGRQVSFTARVSSAEVWVLENLLPELEGQD